MKVRPTIFLSGVSHEFGSFRDDVENQVEMKGCFAENQPGFPPDYCTVEEMLRRKLTDCDAVIHIVGFRFGAEPNERPAELPRRSYTQLEFDIARELQKPVYIFLSAAATVRDKPRTPLQPEDPALVALQDAHRAAVQQTNHLYYFFKDKAELCKLVAEIPEVKSSGFQADISRIIKYAPTELIGRESDLSVLSDAWIKVRQAETQRPNVLTFVALGGEGKTSLVAKWAADLAHQDWPGCDAVFAWSFYSQGTREQVAASSDLFLAEALRFFGDAAMADSPAGAFDKGKRLVQLVGERRALLILDGLEPLQYSPTSPTPGELKDQGIAALLKGLAGNSRGLCVVTTRYSIPDLKAFWQTTAPEHELLRLSTNAGVDLLRRFGVKGTLLEFETLVEDVKGHALTLNLLGGFLKRAFKGDIRQRDRVKFEKADDKIQGGHAFRTIAAYVRWMQDESDEARRELAILQLLGLFDRPASADCIRALIAEPVIPGLTEPLVGLAEDDWEFSLTGLQEAKLLTVNRDAAGTMLSLDAHPLLREYFAKWLRSHHAPRDEPSGTRVTSQGSVPTSTDAATIEAHLAERDGYIAWQTAHRRLYEHLCKTTPDKPDATLEDLQPLYQAVAHGCHAGLTEDARATVYRDRIQRGRECFSTFKLGALGSDLGAIACFFMRPWSQLLSGISEGGQAWLLNEAAFRLRALGRLTEALEPMRAGLEMEASKEHWKNAAIGAGNLSELELTLGEVAAAVRDAEQSVTYADRSGDAFWKMGTRTAHADALHQAGGGFGEQPKSAAGSGSHAEALFGEAEQMQAERQPEYPRLYSLPGFRYCDLLLAEAERAAWRKSLESRDESPEQVSARQGLALDSGLSTLDVQQSCRAVSGRANTALKIVLAGSRNLLDIALNNLTLGRAALYEAILSNFEIRNSKSEIDHAVSGLRRAGTTHHIPRGLLTRAWLRSLTGLRTGPDSAQSDLDEAWEIAERGPMPLFMADIHLHRARLFGRNGGVVSSQSSVVSEEQYPWESAEHDLKEARRLIEKHGYLRRMEELEDAESAINGVG